VDFIEYCRIGQATDKAAYYLTKRGCACIGTSVPCEIDGLHQIKLEIARATEKMIAHVKKVYPSALITFIGIEDFDQKASERRADWIKNGYSAELANRDLQECYFPTR